MKSPQVDAERAATIRRTNAPSMRMSCIRPGATKAARSPRLRKFKYILGSTLGDYTPNDVRIDILSYVNISIIISGTLRVRTTHDNLIYIHH